MWVLYTALLRGLHGLHMPSIGAAYSPFRRPDTEVCGDYTQFHYGTSGAAFSSSKGYTQFL